MESLIVFGISYIVLFILYIIIFYIMGLKMKKILNSNQVRFLKVRFGLKDKDFNPKVIGIIICLIFIHLSIKKFT